MKKRHFRMAAFAITACLGLSMSLTAAVPAFAASKEEVQSQIEGLKSQQSALESKLSELKKNKSDTESYISQLDSEIDTYRSQLEDVTAEITKTEGEIELTQDNLTQAKEDEQTQYTALKQRIKTMYEAGNESYVEMLLSADDLKSLLNDQEYASKINEYDQELLSGIQATEKKIADYEKELQAQKEVQEAQKEKYEIAKEDVEKIVAQKQTELASIGSSINSVSSDISSTQAEIDQENNVLAQIVEQERQAAEEEARRQAEAAAQAAQQAAAQTADSDNVTNTAATQTYAAADNSSNSDSYYSGSDDSDSDSEASYTQASSSESSSSSGSSSSSSGMIWPGGSTITSYYGGRTAPTAGATTNHQGIDISASEGSAISAAASGTVSTVGYNSAMGNYVVINHGNGVSTYYEHCSSVNVSEGQSVSQGETIAAVGSTGVATGAHLHFGVSVGGSYVNPLTYVSP